MSDGLRTGKSVLPSSLTGVSSKSVSAVTVSFVSGESILCISVSDLDGFFSEDVPQAHKDNTSEAKRIKDIIFLICHHSRFEIT